MISRFLSNDHDQLSLPVLEGQIFRLLFKFPHNFKWMSPFAIPHIHINFICGGKTNSVLGTNGENNHRAKLHLRQTGMPLLTSMEWHWLTPVETLVLHSVLNMLLITQNIILELMSCNKISSQECTNWVSRRGKQNTSCIDLCHVHNHYLNF